MRYRGYYYDFDLGAYYLQSRYYMPLFSRFLNADLPEYAKIQKADSNGLNLFAYCNNEPVNNSDPNGTVAQYIIMGAIGGTLNLFLYWCDCELDHKNMDFWKAVGNFCSGVASGVSSTLGLSIWQSISVNIVTTLSSLAFSSSISEDTLMAEICVSVIIGIATGIAGGSSVKSNKYISSVERQFVKKISNTIKYNKGIKPAINALKYAFKHTKSYFVGFIKSFIKSSTWSSFIKYGNVTFRKFFS